ncbi:MAG: hypothetical protein ACOYMF_14325 [Bacteroidales bacterium]
MVQRKRKIRKWQVHPVVIGSEMHEKEAIPYQVGVISGDQGHIVWARAPGKLQKVSEG